MNLINHNLAFLTVVFGDLHLKCKLSNGFLTMQTNSFNTFMLTASYSKKVSLIQMTTSGGSTLNPSAAKVTFIQCTKKQKIMKIILTLSYWYSLESSYWVQSNEYTFATVSVISQLFIIILCWINKKLAAKEWVCCLSCCCVWVVYIVSARTSAALLHRLCLHWSGGDLYWSGGDLYWSGGDLHWAALPVFLNEAGSTAAGNCYYHLREVIKGRWRGYILQCGELITAYDPLIRLAGVLDSDALQW